MSKEDKIGDRIEILREKLGNLSISALEKGKLTGEERLLGNGTISDWVNKNLDWTSDKLEKFLKHWNVNRVWWETGTGDIFNKKSTYVEIPSDNKENQMEPEQFFSTFKSLVEGTTEYLLVPRGVLKDNYRLISLEQYQKDMEQLKKDREQIEMYKDEFNNKNKQIDTLLIANKELSLFNNELLQKLVSQVPQPLSPQKSNQNPGVTQ